MNRLHHVALVLIVALLAAGCKVTWKGDWEGRGDGALYGSAIVRYDGFPISGAQVRLTGPVQRQATTTRSGTFTFRNLPEGTYTLTLSALHGSYTASLWVGGSTVFEWGVQPAGFDRQLFYQISGLKKYYVDSYGRLEWEYGTLVRWEQPAIRVYMDVAAAPPGFHSTWPDRYWNEIRRWEEILKGRVAFRRVYSPAEADILVRWHPEGFLGDQAGIARHLAYYENGAIKRVLIEIDVAYGDAPGLFVHELAHGMGVDHVTDPASVMYPWMEPGQRTSFSAKEREHIRLMYDIPSGQRLASGYYLTIMSNQAAEVDARGEAPGEGAGDPGDGGPGYGSAAGDGAGSGDAGGAGGESTLVTDPLTGYRGHIVSRDGAHVELDEDVAAWLMGI